MSLAAQVAALATRIGQEIKSVRASQGGGGGSVAATQVTLDFGTTPVSSKTFSFADAAASASSKIIMTPSAKPTAGMSVDELEMDNFVCAAECENTGTIIAVVTAFPGPVTGLRNFNYILG